MYEVIGEGPFFEEVSRRIPGPPPGVLPILGVAANLRRILKPGEIARYPMGVVGYHPSLLPRHRGPDAIGAACRAGDPVVGGTVYRFTGNVDAGPILVQDWAFRLPNESPRELYRRVLFPMGVRLLLSVVDHVTVWGSLPPTTEQDVRFATYHGGKRGGH